MLDTSGAIAPTIRGLTLWQPWATLVAIGAKRYETRSWKPPKRVTRIALHAAKRISEAPGPRDRELFHRVLRDRVIPLGCILGIFDIVDVIETDGTRPPGGAEYERTFGDYTPGRYAWRLEPVLICQPPIYCKGGQRFWWLPESIHMAIDQAVEYSVRNERKPGA